MRQIYPPNKRRPRRGEPHQHRHLPPLKGLQHPPPRPEEMLHGQARLLRPLHDRRAEVPVLHIHDPPGAEPPEELHHLRRHVLRSLNVEIHHVAKPLRPTPNVEAQDLPKEEQTRGPPRLGQGPRGHKHPQPKPPHRLLKPRPEGGDLLRKPLNLLQIPRHLRLPQLPRQIYHLKRHPQHLLRNPHKPQDPLYVLAGSPQHAVYVVSSHEVELVPAQQPEVLRQEGRGHDQHVEIPPLHSLQHPPLLPLPQQGVVSQHPQRHPRPLRVGHQPPVGLVRKRGGGEYQQNPPTPPGEMQSRHQHEGGLPRPGRRHNGEALPPHKTPRPQPLRPPHLVPHHPPKEGRKLLIRPKVLPNPRHTPQRPPPPQRLHHLSHRPRLDLPRQTHPAGEPSRQAIRRDRPPTVGATMEIHHQRQLHATRRHSQ